MQLHPAAKVQILAALKQGLPLLRVKNGMFVDGLSGLVITYKADEALPKTGKFREQLVDWIDDTPIATFVCDRVAQELSVHGEYVLGEVVQNLPELPGYADTDALAERLVAEFEALPWSYTLTLNIPDGTLPALADGTTHLEITKDSSLVVSDLFLKERYSLHHEDEALIKRLQGGGLLALMDPKLEWEEGATFFQSHVEGFIGPYGSGSPFDTANRALRRFLGLGLGMRLFSFQRKFEPIPKKRRWWIHKRIDESWVIENRLTLDDEDSIAVSSISLWNNFNPDYPEDQKNAWLAGLLFQVGRTLSSTDSATLSLAAEWFFDSFKGRDEVLTYVRRMTCLEILLGEHGDTSKVSLGELLGNRLSYLIGKSHSDRVTVLKQFREIYGIRSKILHHGKHRFAGSERMLFATLRLYCERALQEESRMITADADKK